MTKPLTVLLTNDDGINAPGIVALERQFKESYPEVVVWTVAPNKGRSTSSHAMNLARPVFVYDKGKKRVAVDGFPADCVYLALYGLMEHPPDVVVSGINAGANMGKDVIYSGTVACAREAAIRKIHGVAASLVHGEDYSDAAKNVCKIALEVAARPKKPVILLNLNYPGGRFEGPRLARLGIRKYPHIVSKREAPLTNASYYWLGGPPVQDEHMPGTDSWLIHRGVASATPLLLDQTDDEGIATAETVLPFIEPPEELS
jgi:5'-nucleotidase